MANINTDKNVYILGAGFSKELGLPLQDDFLLVAKEVFFRNPSKYKHFERVFGYQNQLSKMRQFLNYPLLNLEHLFNLVEMDIFYSRNPEVIEIKNDFLKLINDTLVELTPNPFKHGAGGYLEFNPSYNNYLKFLTMFIANERPIHAYNDTIISFNYDLVIEATTYLLNWKNNQKNMSPVSLNVIFGKENLFVNSISQIFTSSRQGSYFPSEDIFTNADSERTIKLIKLHGSINWTTPDGKTFIVPPTWNKSDPEIRKLWDIAYNELKEAKRIIIIGYSFPETDIYVKSLLALALNENRILQNIYFINPDTEIVKKACLSLLDKHFEKYCSYEEWTFREFINGQGQLFIKEKLNRLAR